jgi:hypothetical protein
LNVEFPNEVEDHVEDCVHNWDMYPWFWYCFLHSTHGTFLVLIKFIILYCHFYECANSMITLETRIDVIFQVINVIKFCMFWQLLSFIFYFFLFYMACKCKKFCTYTSLHGVWKQRKWFTLTLALFLHSQNLFTWPYTYMLQVC